MYCEGIELATNTSADMRADDVCPQPSLRHKNFSFRMAYKYAQP